MLTNGVILFMVVRRGFLCVYVVLAGKQEGDGVGQLTTCPIIMTRKEIIQGKNTPVSIFQLTPCHSLNRALLTFIAHNLPPYKVTVFMHSMVGNAKGIGGLALNSCSKPISLS